MAEVKTKPKKSLGGFIIPTSVNLEYASKGITAMKIKHEVAKEGKKLTVTAEGRTSEVDIKFHDNVGIKQQDDGTLAFVGDFYYTEWKNSKKFQENLQGQYAVADAVEKLEEQGYFVDNTEDIKVGDDGLIRFNASNPYS